jgi:hypothetical protein
MNKYFLILFLLFSAKSKAETNWYRVSANTPIIIHWMQTIEISKNDNFIEGNRYLGPYPSESDVNKFFIMSLLFINITGELLPKRYSKYFYLNFAILRTKTVVRNYEFGVRINF